MRSTLPRRLLPAAFLPLLLMSCAPVLTPPPLARTERPMLPPLPAGTTQTEQLASLTAKPTGQLVTIDSAVLAELTDRLAETVGAMERLKGHVLAITCAYAGTAYHLNGTKPTKH
ncbi:hypothetical protein [Sphingomonas morindae]|uniref:Uncharacterized protein n=1 Tax=Sphingomonas morindae TaxID=1541170 RepID=A0ABY4X9K0_9SPHN|nr:hypothetical protein [Sphingomonas morindae]USI73530.1 hypothetical protein LHA26_03345 [Sphingomonas morindae]